MRAVRIMATTFSHGLRLSRAATGGVAVVEGRAAGTHRMCSSGRRVGVRPGTTRHAWSKKCPSVRAAAGVAWSRRMLTRGSGAVPRRARLHREAVARGEGRTTATGRAQTVASKLAVLHEPDMVAGGWASPDPTRTGRSSVDSSIVGSWNQGGRLSTMEGAASDAISGGRGDALMNVKLELCRGKGRR
ncbi:polymorphic toxin type 15 domain-containing protein [Burkholderia sp. LMG 32019]|uniref:polymorphic toxin type 15 domain-containing protein n=1 Tax=Burkholderia sp. LMG 32019 TaxID=3158173 RepID=UPI003C2D6D0E